MFYEYYIEGNCQTICLLKFDESTYMYILYLYLYVLSERYDIQKR